MKQGLEAERFSQIVFYATVLLIGYLAWRIVGPFLPEIGWAIVLAIGLEPARAIVAPRLGRTRTALLLSLLALVLIVVPVVFIAATLVNEGGGAVDYVGEQLRAQGGPGARFHAAWGWLRARAPFLPTEPDMISRITAGLGGLARFLASQATRLLASAAWLLFALVITMGVLFFLLRDASVFARSVRRILPFGAEQNDRLMGMAYELVSASVSATLAIAIAQGTIGGAAFALLGIPGAVLWGVMMGLLSFLPLLGAAVIWVPAATWLVLSGSPVRGILMAVVGFGIMGQVDNVVRPLVLSGKSKLSTLVLLISMMGGVSAFGFLGIVLGPLVAALLTALFETYEGSPESPPPEAGKAMTPCPASATRPCAGAPLAKEDAAEQAPADAPPQAASKP